MYPEPDSAYNQSARFREEENFPAMIPTPDRSALSQLAALTTPTRFSSHDRDIVKEASQKFRFCAAHVVCDVAGVRVTIPTVRGNDGGEGSAVRGKRKSKLARPRLALAYDVRAVVPR